MPALRAKADIQKYIESRVFKIPADNGCWWWLGPVDRQGYGRMTWDRPGMPNQRLVHRVVFIAYHGEPGSLHVCHTCDNPGCCSPDHLFLGTAADNSADKVAKGRQARHKGVANPNRKLTESEVLKIRRFVADGMTQTDVGPMFGVTQQNVSRIVNRKVWPDI